MYLLQLYKYFYMVQTLGPANHQLNMSDFSNWHKSITLQIQQKVSSLIVISLSSGGAISTKDWLNQTI